MSHQTGAQVRRRLNVVGILVGLVVAGCHDNPTLPGGDKRGPGPTSLIANGSFESGGQPTLSGWRVPGGRLAQAAPEGAPGGGAWSLRLEADWAPTRARAVAAVPEVRDGDLLQLTGWVRAVGTRGGGAIEIISGSAPTFDAPHVRVAASADTVWASLTVRDTVSLAPGDSVWVVLTSFDTERFARVGLFDRIELIRLHQ